MTGRVKNKLTKLETIFEIQKRALLILAAKGEYNNFKYDEVSTLALKENGLLIQFSIQSFFAIDIFEQLRLRPKTLKDRPFRLYIEDSDERVFHLQWDVAGARRLVRFKRGAWETQLGKLHHSFVIENEDFNHMLLLAANSFLVEPE